MVLRIVRNFDFHKVTGTLYMCEHVGDELPLHDHSFNHITIATIGEIECFTDDGVVVRCKPGDAPVEYIAGRKHGIRGVTDGAMFLNISPQIGTF